jgi:ribonuclease PH
MVSWPVRSQVAAVSVGIHGGLPYLDLDYSEDSTAEVDMNIVATDAMKFIELQGTAEKGSFSEDEMSAMIALAKGGIEQLVAKQREIISPLVAQIDEIARERLKSKFKK